MSSASLNLCRSERACSIRNVPVRAKTAAEMAEIERKAQEIEKDSRFVDVDEDDAGVKRRREYSSMQHNDEGAEALK